MTDHQAPADGQSPSLDYASMTAASPVRLRGYFDRLSSHACEWQTSGRRTERLTTPGLVTANGTTLTCPFPAWPYGVRAAVALRVLTAQALVYSSSAANGSYVSTEAPAAAAAAPLWIRACLQPACGFPLTVVGRAAAAGWFWGAASSAYPYPFLSNRVHTIPRTFRFLAPSAVYSFGRPHPGKGQPVATVSIVAGGRGYLPGDLRILAGPDPAADDGGSSFAGSFTVDASGAIVSAAVSSPGVGYSSTSPSPVPVYPGTLTRMEGSVTVGTVVAGGDWFVAGRWELDGRLAGATANATGSFTVANGSISSGGLVFFERGAGYDPSVALPPHALRLTFAHNDTLQTGRIVQVPSLLCILYPTASSPCLLSCPASPLSWRKQARGRK